LPRAEDGDYLTRRTESDAAMADAMDLQIAAYEAILPELRNKFGSVWALLVERRLVKTFPEFSAAADYVARHHAGDQVLIRHTDEAREMAPYVHIGG
jgi:hypothetical protein